MLATGALIAATLAFTASPAAAEEPPLPAPIATTEPALETTPTPSETTPTPSTEPVEPTQTPTPTPTSAEPAPTEQPTESEPTAEPTPASATVVYSGTALQLSEEHDTESGLVIFQVEGLGYLSVDVSRLETKPDATAPVALTLRVPSGLTLSGGDAARFTQLANASVGTPLVAENAARVKQTTTIAETQSLVNQTPNVAATHHVYAVYVSPSNRKEKDPGHTGATTAQNLVSYANSYWSAQSSGSVSFVLDGVVPWYQSTYSCSTNSGSTALWNQALAKAKTAGFVPGRNKHLVLIFPNGSPSYSYCGGAIGLGTVGGSVNQGGLTWVMGTTNPMARETIAHELGHNMSLGHANWLACDGSNPFVGTPPIGDCYLNEYGDASDVMGFGMGDGESGALSSPQAIRAGIWNSAAWVHAPFGTNTYALQPVSGHSGLRSVVLQGKDGTAYFIEYRNFTNEDAGNDQGCDDQICTVPSPNVRILRFEPSGYQGYPGAGSLLVGRDYTNVGYTGPGTYLLQGGGQIVVNSVGSSSASVTVTRGAITSPESNDWILLKRSTSYDSTLRVGDTLSLTLGDYWNMEPSGFTWYRDGAVIAGATTQNYTLTRSDLGAKINASVVLDGIVRWDNCQSGRIGCGSRGPLTGASAGLGPVAAGVYQSLEPGAVAIDNSATPLEAVTTAWPSGTDFSYQWLRGATATTATTPATGTGATTASYTPNAADANQFLRVKVTASVPGYQPVARYSPAANYSLKSSSTITITGSGKLGTEHVVDDSAMTFTDAAGTPVTGVTTTYQWLRNGVPITDFPTATVDASDDNDFTLTQYDYAQNITLRITTSKPGYVSKVTTTPAFKPTIKGTITSSSPAVVITNEYDPTAPMEVRLISSVSGVSETDTFSSAQWYRVNRSTGVPTAIPGAVLSAYKPVAADYPYELRVVVTIKKLNYDSLPITSIDRDFSLRLDPAFPLIIQGGSVAEVDQALSANNPEFHAEILPDVFNTVNLESPGISSTHQWRRAGVDIVGATSRSYTPVAADVTKAVSYATRVEYQGYLPFIGTSPNSAPVALATLEHNQNVSITYPDPAKPLLLQADANINDTTPLAAAISYQWTRNGVAISGATGNQYTLNPALDYGKTIKAKVTYTKPGYRPFEQQDANGTGNYWVRANSVLPEIVGPREVGGTLSVDSRVYFDMRVPTDGMTIPSGDVVELYAWFRAGTLVSTDPTYTLTAADRGKVITVRVTASGGPSDYDHMLPSVATSVATPAIGDEVLPGSNSPTPILVVQPDPPSTPYVTVLGHSGTNITSPGGPDNTVAYQWFRDRVAITGATKSTYALTKADRGTDIELRITTSHAAINGVAYTTDVRWTNARDFTLNASAGADITIYSDMSVGSELAPTLPTFTDADGTTVSPFALQQKFQWYRTAIVDGKTVKTAINGATGSYYYLQAADLGARISVTVTTGNVGFIPHVATYTTTPSTLKVLVGTLQGTGVAPTVTVNNPATNQLIATPPEVTGKTLFPASLTQHASFTYQWLRNNAPITGATKQTYVLTSADRGKTINVKVTAKLAGYTSAVLPLSTPTNYSITPDLADPPRVFGADWSVGQQVDLVDLNFDTKDGDLASPTIKVEWLRIKGTTTTVVATGTSTSYSLVAADYGARVTARLTVTKPGYVSLVHTVPSNINPVVAKGVSSPGVYAVVQDGPGAGILTAAVGDLSPTKPTPAYTYQWLRNNAPISGATAKTYKLVTADAGKLISVKITITRTNFTVPTMTRTSPQADRTIYADTGAPVITGDLSIGQTLGVNSPDFYDDAARTTVNTTHTPVFTWYRSGVAITGATGPAYTLVAADLGKPITVRVRATQAGRLAATTVLSDPVVASAGMIDAGDLIPDATLDVTTRKASVTFSGAAITPGLTTGYKWYRNGTLISTATASSYTLLATDTGKQIRVVITLTKPGYTSFPLAVTPGLLVNGFTQVAPVGIAGDSTIYGTVTCQVPTFFLASGAQLDSPGATATTADDGTIAISWFRQNALIPGAAGATYTTQPEDEDRDLRCDVTVSAPLHAPLTESSPPHHIPS